MKIPPDIERAGDLLDALRRSIHKTYWSYSAQLERLELFKKGHDQDAKSWSDRAQSNPADENLQRLADNGSQGIGYLDLILTELQDYSSSFQSFMLFVDDVELQLGIPKA
jgi:hypothetical protein